MTMWKRWFASLLVAAFGLAVAAPVRAQDAGMLVYVGTYTGPKSKGIYVMRMDPATGALSEPQVAAEVASPSFLAIHPGQKLLYAVSEVGGKSGGFVTAHPNDPQTPKPSLPHQQPTRH